MDRLHTGCKLHRRCRSVEQSALESYTRQIDNIRFVYIVFFVCAAAVCCCRRRFFPIAFFFRVCSLCSLQLATQLLYSDVQ